MLYTTTGKWKLLLLILFNSNRVRNGFIYVSDLNLLSSLRGINYNMLYHVSDTEANLNVAGSKENLSVALVKTNIE